jgi:hypothetical protein
MGFFGGGGAAPANMGGATSSVAGTAGLVPAPAAGSQKTFLRGDATFKPIEYMFRAPVNNLTHNMGAVNGSSVPFFSYIFGVGGSTGTLTALQCRFTPILIPKADTYTRLAADVNNSNAGTNCSVAIYSPSSTTYLPETKLADTGSMSTATAGVIEGTISQYLDEGFYWVGVCCDSNLVQFRINNSSYWSMFGTNRPNVGEGRTHDIQVRLTNTIASITSWPATIATGDLTLNNDNSVNLAIRKV